MLPAGVWIQLVYTNSIKVYAARVLIQGLRQVHGHLHAFLVEIIVISLRLLSCLGSPKALL